MWIRGWAPLETTHGKLGLLAAVDFGLVWWLGRKLLARRKELAGRHGLLAVAGLFAGGIAALLGLYHLP